MSADMTDDDNLKRELLRLDVLLRRKQAWWEHPRNAAVILGVAVAAAGLLGYKIGATPPAPIIIHLDHAPT